MPHRLPALLGLLGLLTALCLAGCMRVAEDAFFYSDARLRERGMHLPAGPPLPEGAHPLGVQAGEARIAATLVDGAEGAPLLLYCGGNLFRRAQHGARVADALAPFGSVLLFDYPGYGESTGEASVAGFQAAARAVARAARETARAQGRPLVAWGQSLGGPICAEAARAADADALVIETSTASARAAVDASLGALRHLVRVRIDPALDGFDVVDTLAGYQGRVLVLEAGRDRTLPPRLSQALASDLAAAGVEVAHLVFPQAGHNDLSAQPDFVRRVAAALAD